MKEFALTAVLTTNILFENANSDKRQLTAIFLERLQILELLASLPNAMVSLLG